MDAFPDAELESFEVTKATDMPETPDFNQIMQMAQNAQAELQKGAG